MSVESRIREGLRANTQRLQPALGHDDEVVMRKVEQRRRDRRVRYTGAGLVVAAAAAVAVVWAPSTVQDEPARPSTPATEDAEPTVTPLPMAGSVGPGTYLARFSGGGPLTSRAVIDVPEGFDALGGVAVVQADGPRGVGFWTASKVKPDPCNLSDLGEDPGPLVSDLAEALQDQEVTEATRPVPITLGGYDGLFLELSTPERGAAEGCAANQYDLWTIGSGGSRYIGPGEVLSLWILDVAGDRLVVDASGSDDGSAVGSQVRDIVDSVRIVDPEF
jgi:hypothetical protein